MIGLAISIGERCGSRICIEIDRRVKGRPMITYKCDCGHQQTISATSFRARSRCKWCHGGGPKRKYGNRLAGETRLYKIWTEMRRRCRARDYWAGRGISVCEEWDNSFSAFEEWSLANNYGPKMTIDRLDSRGNYEPSNCEWVTKAENGRRMRAAYRFVRLEKFSGVEMLSFGS